jgi:hypothetical protein
MINMISYIQYLVPNTPTNGNGHFTHSRFYSKIIYFFIGVTSLMMDKTFGYNLPGQLTLLVKP